MSWCCDVKSDDYSVKHAGERPVPVCRRCLRKPKSYDAVQTGTVMIVMPFLHKAESVICNRCGNDVTKHGWCVDCDGPVPKMGVVT